MYFQLCSSITVCAGIVRNTEPLNADKVSHYDLVVKAEDCGGRVSDDAFVSIQIIPVCKRGLTGRRLHSSFIENIVLDQK